MAGNGPFVLPQYQGNLYDIQRQQMLAAALTQNALTQQAPTQTVGSGGSQNYQVMPKMSPLQPLSQLGQAYLAAKLSQQAGQGLNNLGQAQMNWATGSGSGLGAMSNAVGNMGGDGSSPLQSAPAGQPADAGTVGANAASGPSGAANNVTAQQQGALAPGGSLNPAGWPIQMAAMRFFADPEGYWKDQAAAIAPTDQIKNNQWMHITPEQAGANYQNEATKNATITGRWGYATPNGQGGFTPTVVPNQIPGSQLTTTDGGRTWEYLPMKGGPEALTQKAGAEAAGASQYKPVQVFNSQTGRYEWQTVANMAGAANGQQQPSTMPNGLPATQNGLPDGAPMTPLQRSVMNAESGGRAAAFNPASGATGTMQVTPTGAGSANPGFGVTPARNNSPQEQQRVGVDYLEALRQNYRNDSDALVAYNWGPQNADKWIAAGRPWNQLPPATQQYVGKVLAQTQNYQQPQSQPGAGAPYAASPSLGDQANAEAKARGQVDTMNTSYKEVRQARATGQNALTMLDDMTNYAQTKSPALANKLYNVQGVFSSDAQLFEKGRNNLITQVANASGMGTDAAREIVEGAIPSFGMNPQAIQTGLGQIKAQVQMRMVKGDYLSDAYANGNATAYNQRENQFDQTMTPTAAAIIKMPAGQARNQAISAAKSNPQDAQALRWGLSVGLLR